MLVSDYSEQQERWGQGSHQKLKTNWLQLAFSGGSVRIPNFLNVGSLAGGHHELCGAAGGPGAGDGQGAV